MGVVYVPLALLGDHLLGYKGIFGATAVTNALMGIGAVWWVRRTLRQQIALRPALPVEAATAATAATAIAAT